MNRTAMFLGMLAVGFANAQYDGKVGINTKEPKATLEINAYQKNGSTKEGILIPKLKKAAAKAMITSFPKSGANKIEEATLIYVEDNVEAGDNAQFVGTGKGFYYFDATNAVYKWTKLGAGTNASATAVPFQNLRGNVTTLRKGANPEPGLVVDASAVNYTIQSGDFLIVTNNAENTTINFPATSAAEKGRVVHIFNNNTVTGGIGLLGNFVGQSGTNQRRGRTFVSDGEKWVGVAL